MHSYRALKLKCHKDNLHIIEISRNYKYSIISVQQMTIDENEKSIHQQESNQIIFHESKCSTT